MLNWFKCSHADVWDGLEKRYTALEHRVSRLELSESSFRDKVLRKMQKETVQPEESEGLYHGQLIKER